MAVGDLLVQTTKDLRGEAEVSKSGKLLHARDKKTGRMGILPAVPSGAPAVRCRAILSPLWFWLLSCTVLSAVRKMQKESMMRQMFSSLMLVLALGAAFSAPLAAQPPREMPAQTVDVNDDDDGFDFGWLGLLGFAGLLGLKRREVHDVHTVRTDPNRPSTVR